MRGGAPRIEGNALRERRALGLSLRAPRDRGASALRRWSPCGAGAFDAGGDRVQVFVDADPRGVFVFDARTGALLGECDTAEREGAPRYRFGWHTRVEGFSMDGGAVLGGIAGYDDAVAPARHAVINAVLWSSTTGAELERWPLASNPIWSAERDSVFGFTPENALESRLVPDLWSGELWRVALPSLRGVELLLAGDGCVLIALGYAAAAGPTRIAVAFDARTGRERWRVERPVKGRRSDGALAVDRSLLLLLSDALEAFDVYTGAPCALTGDAREEFALAAAPRALSQTRARSFVAAGGVVRRFFPGGVEDDDAPEGFVGAVTDVALSRSGGRAVTSSAARELRVWDARAGAPGHRLEAEGGELDDRGIALSPDERDAFATKKGGIVRWSLEAGAAPYEFAHVTNRELGTPPRPTLVSPAELHAPVLSPDGATLIAVSEGRAPGEYALAAFDVGAQRLRWTAFVRSSCAPTVRIGPVDAHPRVLVGVGGAALVVSFDPAVGRVSQSPDLAGFEQTVSVVLPTDSDRGWCVVDGRLREFAGARVLLGESVADGPRVEAPYAQSDDGRWLFTGSDSGDALLWRLREDSGASCMGRVELAAALDALSCASFDARGETLLIGTERGLVLCYALRED